ncbi:MAG: hypothetical protein HQL68_02105 [Magnetococcales bacterium]|nr:hypothetical protein [Magnetococcales bacterium]
MPDNNNREYSFWLGGHLYGSRKISPSVYLSDNVHLLTSGNERFFVSLGDIIKYPSYEILNNLSKVVSTIPIPFYNALGNHDGTHPPKFATHFGSTSGIL